MPIDLFDCLSVCVRDLIAMNRNCSRGLILFCCGLIFVLVEIESVLLPFKYIFLLSFEFDINNVFLLS